METAQAVEFPRFKDGDTFIALTTTRCLQLHANILRQHSVTFAQYLSEARGALLTTKAKKEGRVIRYRLDLERVEDDSHGRFRAGVSISFQVVSREGGSTNFNLSYRPSVPMES